MLPRPSAWHSPSQGAGTPEAMASHVDLLTELQLLEKGAHVGRLRA